MLRLDVPLDRAERRVGEGAALGRAGDGHVAVGGHVLLHAVDRGGGKVAVRAFLFREEKLRCLT